MGKQDDTTDDRRQRLAKELRVEPGKRARLDERDTGWRGGKEFEHLDADELDETAKEILQHGVEELADAQELLWASANRSLLVVFQAMDAAGKDSTIKHVMSGVNPQGVEVRSFKKPTPEELDHPFLWRHWIAAPGKGRIGIFNRSHYEEVVTLRVHPDWLGAQRVPLPKDMDDLWAGRFEDINAFERHLVRTGTTVVKFFLHVSKAEQKKRFLRRLDEADKEWKFSAADVVERRLWDQYQEAFEEAITATSTPWAPWYVIPADHKHTMQAMVAQVLVAEIEAMDLTWPTVSADEQADNERARQELEAEGNEDKEQSWDS